MEGIILAGIIVPYFVSLAAGLTTDYPLYDFVDNLKKKGKKKINHDLQRAVKRSFLSAIQDIILECQNKLRQTASRKYPLLGNLEYPDEYRKDVRWLDGKFKELVRELKQIEHSDNISPIFDSFDEIELLLKPTGGPAQEKFQAFEKKLVAVALKDVTAPECYQEKVKADLFQRMCDKFAKEIKYTPEVYNIFTATILPQINQTLLKNQQKLQDIEALLQPSLTHINERLKNIENILQPKYDKKVEITLGTDFESLSLPELWEIIEKLQQKVKIKMLSTEIGSIKLIFETTEKGAKEIDLLFRTGRLGKILGKPIKDVHISNSLLRDTSPFRISDTFEKFFRKLNNLVEKPFAEWALLEMGDEDQEPEEPCALIHTYGHRKDAEIIVLEESDYNPDKLKNDIQLIKSGEPYYLQVLIQNEEGIWFKYGEKVKNQVNIPLVVKDPGCDTFILLIDQDDDSLDKSMNIIINALNNGEKDTVFSTTIIIVVEVGTGGVK